MTIHTDFHFILAASQERDNTGRDPVFDAESSPDFEIANGDFSDFDDAYSDDSSSMDSDYDDECPLVGGLLVDQFREHSTTNLTQEQIEEFIERLEESLKLSNVSEDSEDDTNDNDSIILARRNRGLRRYRKSQRSSLPLGNDSLHLTRNDAEDHDCCDNSESDYESDYSVPLKGGPSDSILSLAPPTSCTPTPSSRRKIAKTRSL